MFGLRRDGKKIKTIDPLMKIIPHVMRKRNDAMVMMKYDIDCSYMDDFIFEKRREESTRFTYMHILVASMVRVFAKRPKLNRFIMNGRIYKRNNIQIAFTMKKKLIDAAEETTVKMTFDGTESIYDVKARIDEEIKKNTGMSAENETDRVAKALTWTPNFLIKLSVGFFKWLDKHGMLPKKILHVSPFHTSLFLTNMKSIKMNYVYHHIYNFGTTSIFISMGKERYVPVVKDHDDETFGIRKSMEAGIVVDERICDGLYYGNSLHLFKRLMEDPSQLEEPLEEKVEDIR
jgi:hypothetical protein